MKKLILKMVAISLAIIFSSTTFANFADMKCSPLPTDGKNETLFLDRYTSYHYDFDFKNSFNKGTDVDGFKNENRKATSGNLGIHGFRDFDIQQNSINSEEEEKRIVKDFNIRELMNGRQGDIILYGCVYEPKSSVLKTHIPISKSHRQNFEKKLVYFILSPVDFRSDHEKMKDLMHTLTKSQILGLYLALSKSLSFLHWKGYVHNNVKPENLVLRKSHYNDTEFNKVYQLGLSSFESVTKSDEKFPRNNLSYISSPMAFKNPAQSPIPKDDFYAFALAVLYFENNCNPNIFQKDRKAKKYYQNFEDYSPRFQNDMIENAKSILTPKYGKFQDTVPKNYRKITFTTLIVKILQYYCFEWTDQQILSVLNSQMEKFTPIDGVRSRRVLNQQKSALGTHSDLEISGEGLSFFSGESGASLKTELNSQNVDEENLKVV